MAALRVGVFWALMVVSASADEGLKPYTIVDDAIVAPLTGTTGDPARGRAIVGSRQVG